MKIAIGSDHGGFALKQKLITAFKDEYDFIDVGANEFIETDSYVEYSFKVGEMVKNKTADYGIMICRTGVGAVIALNKMSGIKAGVLETPKGVEIARKKNNINVLSFGADNVNFRLATKLVKIFLNTEFCGGRHENRLKVIEEYEKNHIK